jgi:ribosomal protein L34E
MSLKPTGHFVLATSYSRTTYRRTTIGAAAFHCRVRNGNGWCHCAEVTKMLGAISKQRRLSTTIKHFSEPFLQGFATLQRLVEVFFGKCKDLYWLAGNDGRIARRSG